MAGHRYDWVDYAKGMGIILVVYGHAVRGVFASPIHLSEHFFHISDTAVYAFHMPLFFFLSGLFAARSLAKGARSFAWSKLKTIAYPYVLWSLIQGGIQIVLSGYTNHPMSWRALTEIGWAPIGQFWFLYVLLMCHALYALAARLSPRTLLWAGLALWVTSYFVGNDILSMFLFNFLFYAGGALYADSVDLSPLRVRRWAALALVAAFAAGEALLIGSNRPFKAPAALPVAVLGIAFVLILSMALGASGRLRWIRTLGTMSMTIYILHILAASGARIILEKLAGVNSAPLAIFAATASGLLLPVVAQLAAERLSLAPWLGLSRRA